MKLYRDLNWICLALSVGGALALLLPPTLRDEKILLPALLAFGWIVVCVFFFQWLAVKRAGKTMALLEDCRVREYTAQYEKLLDRAKGKLALPVKLNLSAGYIELGHPGRALELLRDLPDFPKGRQGAALRLAYDNNAAVCHRMLGDLDTAEKLMERYQADLAAAPEKTPQRAQYAAHCHTQAMLLNMARGNFDGARAFFETRLQTAATIRHRVADHYALAWVCDHEGRRDEAREHLRYAAAHGGDTWYVQAAKTRLANLK